jgi:hypothetical protein
MLSALILALHNLGLVARLAALLRVLAAGLLKRLPFFFAMALLALVRGAVGATGRLHPYQEFWFATTWPTTILQAAAAIEAFWFLAGHFRGIENFGWKLLGVIMVTSAAAAITMGTIGRGWNDPLRAPLLIDQFTGLWLVLTAISALLFFSQFTRVPIRPNAITHLTALSILYGTNFTGYSIGVLSHGTMPVLTNLVVTGGVICAYAWWAIKINKKGQSLPFPAEPPMSDSEFDDADAEHRELANKLKEAGSEALKRRFRR